MTERPKEGAEPGARKHVIPVAAPNAAIIPAQFKSVSAAPDLTPGLHLLMGPKASGKTRHSLALYHHLRLQGVTASYRYILEPRASGTRALLDADAWTNWYTASCKALSGGVLILDSITYVVSMLAQLRDLGDMLSKVTYEGGLSPRDIQGVLLHNEIASDAGVAVVATVNSELFPVANKLEGAAEGQITILSERQLSMRNRRTRKPFEFVIPGSADERALKQLGYGRSQTLSGSINRV